MKSSTPPLQSWLMVGICLALLIGCRREADTLTITRDAADENPNYEAASPVPGGAISGGAPAVPYLSKVAPRPDSMLRLQDYKEGDHLRGTDFMGEGICVEFDPSLMIREGETKYCRDMARDRVTLKIDDREAGDPDSMTVMTVEILLVDQEGNVLGRTGGPCQPCWKADLGPGVHIAKLEVQTLLGLEVYEWQFTLVDD